MKFRIHFPFATLIILEQRVREGRQTRDIIFSIFSIENSTLVIHLSLPILSMISIPIILSPYLFFLFFNSAKEINYFPSWLSWISAQSIHFLTKDSDILITYFLLHSSIHKYKKAFVIFSQNTFFHLHFLHIRLFFSKFCKSRSMEESNFFSFSSSHELFNYEKCTQSPSLYT